MTSKNWTCADCGVSTYNESQRCWNCHLVSLRSSPVIWRLHRSGYMVARGGKNMITQHRVIMESILGRPLRPGENVHHKNGVKHDNRPENLELWSRSQPSGQRVRDKTEWAIEWLRLYAPETLADGV